MFILYICWNLVLRTEYSVLWFYRNFLCLRLWPNTSSFSMQTLSYTLPSETINESQIHSNFSLVLNRTLDHTGTQGLWVMLTSLAISACSTARAIAQSLHDFGINKYKVIGTQEVLKWKQTCRNSSVVIHKLYLYVFCNLMPDVDGRKSINICPYAFSSSSSHSLLLTH